MLAIVDYGMGNLRSVQKAFELRGGARAATIIRTPEEVRRADKLIVPGVGAFGDASKVMQESGLGEAIREFVRSGKPLLGICLGLQLLVDVGFEDGEYPGLGIIAGKCVRFTVDQPKLGGGGEHLKVPHMGWNSLSWTRPVPLFKGLEQGSYVYFVHSYHVVPTDPGVIGATADYGGPFVAALWKDNVMATQFHPEKSQQVGGTILENFAVL